MEFVYDNFGRISKINFADNDDQKSFWDNWKEVAVVNIQECGSVNRIMLENQSKQGFILGSGVSLQTK